MRRRSEGGARRGHRIVSVYDLHLRHAKIGDVLAGFLVLIEIE